MTVENISWSISTKECCRPQRGRTHDLLVSSRTAHPTEPPRPAFKWLCFTFMFDNIFVFKSITVTSLINTVLFIYRKSEPNRLLTYQTSYRLHAYHIVIIVQKLLFCSLWIELAGASYINSVEYQTSDKNLVLQKILNKISSKRLFHWASKYLQKLDIWHMHVQFNYIR